MAVNIDCCFSDTLGDGAVVHLLPEGVAAARVILAVVAVARIALALLHDVARALGAVGQVDRQFALWAEGDGPAAGHAQGLQRVLEWGAFSHGRHCSTNCWKSAATG